MVKICPNVYPIEQEEKYKQYFEKYPYELSTFQKYGVEAVVEGHHVLVTAHTGSGKTLSAEFAIEHLVAKGKKVIYTAPIKALSNQKFYEFTHKYPHISFGILTGDIKTNPEADVLIMTTEILLNTLYNKKSGAGSSLIAFDMDLENELGCVVFDEVHYVNDPDRGRVWEESIMMLPRHVQMVMLSATIDKPEKFASWCETRGQPTTDDKIVYLASTNHRVVPLTHYSFITTNTGIYKAIKDKELEKQIRDTTDKLFVIQSANGVFNEPHFHKMRKILDLFETKRVRVKRQHVLNQVCKHMVENNMLPALCFVLSRKQLEVCAKEITTDLLEFDSKVGYTIQRECEQIIRKLPNYQEYLHLPEYVQMVTLLERGIAIHHSGVMPVLKEMVEILYAKGYIKLLFATETFSIGVNMPTKTVVFTNSTKFDGSHMRNLYSHEYTQMAGRAGRRGIDSVGNVIHLNNLFSSIDCTSYKNMMHGMPQTLSSKFKISYNLLLNLVSIGDNNFTEYAKRSMIQEDIDADLRSLNEQIAQHSASNKSADDIVLRTPRNVVEEYISLQEDVKTAINKKRREMERRITNIKDEYKFVDTDVAILKKYVDKQHTIDALQQKYSTMEQYMTNNVSNVLDVLTQDSFIQRTEDMIQLTMKGQIAAQIREVHCLVFASMLDANKFYDLTSRQLVGVFSCFTNVSVADEIKLILPKCDDTKVGNVATEIRGKYDDFLKMEQQQQLNTGADYYMHFDLIDFAMRWCDCESVEECKFLLQTLEGEKAVFLGEFVKALLKINNIASEMEKIAEANGKVEFLSKLRAIPILTLKYVATNQSLYV
jgi:superfamily II RNA helicase